MPHVTTGNHRMTNIKIGNGDYVQGIRRIEADPSGGQSGMPDLTSPPAHKPLRYTPGTEHKFKICLTIFFNLKSSPLFRSELWRPSGVAAPHPRPGPPCFPERRPMEEKVDSASEFIWGLLCRRWHATVQAESQYSRRGRPVVYLASSRVAILSSQRKTQWLTICQQRELGRVRTGKLSPFNMNTHCIKLSESSKSWLISLLDIN